MRVPSDAGINTAKVSERQEACQLCRSPTAAQKVLHALSARWWYTLDNGRCGMRMGDFMLMVSAEAEGVPLFISKRKPREKPAVRGI